MFLFFLLPSLFRFNWFLNRSNGLGKKKEISVSLMPLWILSATKAQDTGTLSGSNLHQIISRGSRFKHLSFQAASD